MVVIVEVVIVVVPGGASPKRGNIYQGAYQGEAADFPDLRETHKIPAP